MTKQKDNDGCRPIPADPAERWIPVDPATFGPERVLSPKEETAIRLGLNPDKLDLKSPGLNKTLAAAARKFAKDDEEALERGLATFEELKRSKERDEAVKEAIERVPAVKEAFLHIHREAIERDRQEAISESSPTVASRTLYKLRRPKHPGDEIEKIKDLIRAEREKHPDRHSDTLAIRKVARSLDKTPESLSRLLRRRAPGFLLSGPS